MLGRIGDGQAEYDAAPFIADLDRAVLVAGIDAVGGGTKEIARGQFGEVAGVGRIAQQRAFAIG